MFASLVVKWNPVHLAHTGSPGGSPDKKISLVIHYLFVRKYATYYNSASNVPRQARHFFGPYYKSVIVLQQKKTPLLEILNTYVTLSSSTSILY